MRIKKITPICVHMPFEHGGKKAKLNGQDWDKLEFVLVKVEMDNGIIGWGESFGYVSWKPVKVAIEEFLAPYIVGRNINTANDIHDLVLEIQKTFHIFGRYGISIYALSGIEIGLWDALGKDKNLPIYSLIDGGSKKEFKAYASLFRYSDTKIIEKKCKEALDRGFNIIKLHEIKNSCIEAARQFVGQDTPLMTDVNCAWSIDEIINNKNFLKKINLLWIEEPIFPPEDFKKLAFLKNELNISIAAGENACTHWEFEKMIDENAVNFTQPSVIKVGGISEMSKIIKYSENKNIPVMPHTAYFGPGFLASLHLASSTKLEVFIERFWLNLKEEFYPDFKTTRNGKYLLPSGPGLGLEFNEKIISKYSV
jgi:D-galactarolactone cycloisomerase